MDIKILILILIIFPFQAIKTENSSFIQSIDSIPLNDIGTINYQLFTLVQIEELLNHGVSLKSPPFKDYERGEIYLMVVSNYLNENCSKGNVRLDDKLLLSILNEIEKHEYYSNACYQKKGKLEKLVFYFCSGSYSYIYSRVINNFPFFYLVLTDIIIAILFFFRGRNSSFYNFFIKFNIILSLIIIFGVITLKVWCVLNFNP